MDDVIKFVRSAQGVVVIGLVVAVVLGFASFMPHSNSSKIGGDGVAETRNKLETASVNVLKAELDIYYVEYGRYPGTLSSLDEYVKDSRKDSISSYEDSKNSLKDLLYVVRGDSQAYKITYTSVSGQSIEVDGNYQQDYH